MPHFPIIRATARRNPENSLSSIYQLKNPKLSLELHESGVVRPYEDASHLEVDTSDPCGAWQTLSATRDGAVPRIQLASILPALVQVFGILRSKGCSAQTKLQLPYLVSLSVYHLAGGSTVSQVTDTCRIRVQRVPLLVALESLPSLLEGEPTYGANTPS